MSWLGARLSTTCPARHRRDLRRRSAGVRRGARRPHRVERPNRRKRLVMASGWLGRTWARTFAAMSTHTGPVARHEARRHAVPGREVRGAVAGRALPAEYHVLRQAGTERAFVGEYTDTKTRGTYSCRACGAELFTSDTKFDSHCGWPSFWSPLAGDHVELIEDRSLGMKRVEVRCATVRQPPRARLRGRGLRHPHRPALLHQLDQHPARARRVGARAPLRRGCVARTTTPVPRLTGRKRSPSRAASPVQESSWRHGSGDLARSRAVSTTWESVRRQVFGAGRRAV